MATPDETPVAAPRIDHQQSTVPDSMEEEPEHRDEVTSSERKSNGEAENQNGQDEEEAQEALDSQKVAVAAAAAAVAAPPPPPPPGPRAARLQDLFASTLAHTLARISWDNFAACYPTAAARSPAALRTVHGAMVQRLGELCAAEFAVVMRQRQVVQRLNELEELGQAAKRRRTENGGSSASAQGPPVPPHILPPTVVLDAHLAPQRRAQAADLAARLHASRQANAARFARLHAQQAEADRLAATLERALADADAAAALLDNNGDSNENALLVELARETRTAEAEMAGV